jgi:DNA-binding transcriptional ArsR family regulator
MPLEAIRPDVAFALLSNRRRRQLLCLLARHGAALSLRTAAMEIICRLEGTELEEITDKTYRSVYVSLYQNHAPRLAEADIVHYDEDARTVRLAYNRRTRTLLHVVRIETRTPRLAEQTWLAGAVAALVGGLALVDPVWTLPWATLVVGGLLFGAWQSVRWNRIPPVDDCGDLAG